MTTPTYHIDQTTRGNTIRLVLDFKSKRDAQLVCHDLNHAFPHAKHEVVESQKLCELKLELK